jgi:hypothetical protein
MKMKILFLGLVLSLFTVSCSKDKNDDGTMTADEAVVNSSIDSENDDVSNVVEDQFDTTLANPSGRMVQASALLPQCAVVTRTPALGTPLTAGMVVTKTIDFGTTGCPMPNGNSLRGQIIMSYTFQPSPTAPQTINVSFNNFYHNLTRIDGIKTLTRSLTGTAPNVHPIVNIVMNIQVTRPNGNVITRTGTRTREFIAGFGTPLIIWDNEFKITGSWTTTHPNNNVQTANITTPVIVKFSCANTTTTPRPSIMAEGIIAYARGTHNATLDFGNGACDNLAVFTLDGVAHTITIN